MQNERLSEAEHLLSVPEESKWMRREAVLKATTYHCLSFSHVRHLPSICAILFFHSKDPLIYTYPNHGPMLDLFETAFAIGELVNDPVPCEKCECLCRKFTKKFLSINPTFSVSSPVCFRCRGPSITASEFLRGELLVSTMSNGGGLCN